MKKTSKAEKKGSFRSWLRSWDEGNFDFSMKTAVSGRRKEEPVDKDKTWEKLTITSIERDEFRAFNRFYPVASVLLTGFMIVFLLFSVVQLPAFGEAVTPANSNEVVTRYVEKGMEETGAVNIVSGVILDYRAFDTLGESHVLFTAAMAVFILLMSERERKESEKLQNILLKDTVLKISTNILVALLMVFGLYVILNGHLGPGGGFSGGAIIGGGLILYTASFGKGRLQEMLDIRTYKTIVCCALVFYSLSKCYSFFCGANGYHSIFSAGTAGRIFSAGLILPLNIAVGIVVALTMYGFYSLFTRRQI